MARCRVFCSGSCGDRIRSDQTEVSSNYQGKPCSTRCWQSWAALSRTRSAWRPARCALLLLMLSPAQRNGRDNQLDISISINLSYLHHDDQYYFTAGATILDHTSEIAKLQCLQFTEILFSYQIDLLTVYTFPAICAYDTYPCFGLFCAFRIRWRESFRNVYSRSV